MEYQEIRKWGYQHNDQDPEEEYRKRIDNYCTLHTGLHINPISRGERLSQRYELFSLPVIQMQLLSDAIKQKSSRINKLTDALPGIASNQLFEHTLTKEIVSTNEIEGVKTTKKEAADAISSVRDGDQKTRLYSFAKMYSKIAKQEHDPIKTPTDIRKIYDFLLKGEIEANNLPDGKIFRSGSVVIGDGINVVHVPKRHENDFLPDIDDWITFVNRQDVPVLVKAFVAHYFFEYIHPFNDGNGRTGRYITCTYLGQKLDSLTAITFSSEVNQNRKRYYDAFMKVEDPRNFGEVTFFVIEMLKILADGQDRLIDNLEEKTDLLRRGQLAIERTFDSEQERSILYLYYQAYLFNDFGYGIEDRELNEYVGRYPKTRTRKIIDRFVDEGVLEYTKKNPLKRKLTEKFFNSIA